MPELPTREELAALLHERHRDFYRLPFSQHKVLGSTERESLSAYLADAVLHRLMRDADTEYSVRWNDDEKVTSGVRSKHIQPVLEHVEYWQVRGDNVKPVSRRSVTFTGEWEPAG